MLNLSSDLTFFGPALPESFVQHELEGTLGKVLPLVKDVEESWRALIRALREPLANAGAIRVRNVVLEPLVQGLGYAEMIGAEVVRTREGDEAGGLLLCADGVQLRAWAVEYEGDLDAPTKRGLNHRFSPSRIAERVLLATGERLGLLTNGVELRLIFSDPARRASFASFSLSQWKQHRYYDPTPDSFRLLLAFARPVGQKALPEVLEQARLKQGQVTKDLRLQARKAVEAFVQGVLDHPANQEKLARVPPVTLAPALWREALIMIYRLLFILRGESGGRDTPPFSFASTSLWRNTYSPSRAQPGNLAWVAQKVREGGLHSGEFLEQGLRVLFRAFERGVSSAELNIASLGGALFGPQSTLLLDGLAWGEQGCAELLDNLLRAPRGKGKGRALARLSYRDLDVEDFGRVYEALLELEPGIASEQMARLRRAKLEVVIPEAQAEKYRPVVVRQAVTDTDEAAEDGGDEEAESEESTDETEEPPGRSKSKTKIEWVEAIPAGKFFLRVGLGRKSSGSFYTPESFVRFLVLETLGPLCDSFSPADDPRPLALLLLKVLDPAMGSGHFLVGACRYVGERLYEACRLCAERGLWERVPEEVAPYLPGRRPEGESEAGLSTEKAKALCKRLVAVHCLYGVDKNPLAVELAKVSLWLESFAEGLPLTFLDHRLVCGDSLLGSINIVGEGPDSPMTPPYATTPMDVALAQGVREKLRLRLGIALQKVRALDATVGVDEQDIAAKQKAKAELDEALRPFVDVCVAWSGGVMLGQEHVDEDGYKHALQLLAEDKWPVDQNGEARIDKGSPLSPGFIAMLKKGREGAVLAYPLAFPEVFFPIGDVDAMVGFNAILGNPPWDKLRVERRDLLASLDVRFLFGKESAGFGSEHESLEDAFQNYPEAVKYEDEVSSAQRTVRYLYRADSLAISTIEAAGDVDIYRIFTLRSILLMNSSGRTGLVLGGGFAKNPTEAPLRKYVFARSRPLVIAHYLNLRQLFQGPSTRISFCLLHLVGKQIPTGEHIRLGFDLTQFADLGTPDGHSKLRVFDYEKCIRVVMETGEIASIGAEIGSGEGKTDNTLNVLQKHRIELGADLHRTQAKPALIELKELYQNENDARLPALLPLLLKANVVPAYSSRSIDLFDSLPRGKSGKWIPDVDLLAKLTHPKVKGLLDRIQFFRLALRATCGHPKTNERSFVVCILPPACLTTNSLLVETRPAQRPYRAALSVCALLNTFGADTRVRVRVQANINKGILRNVELPLVNKETDGFLAHSALRLVCNHSGYAPLWDEQLSNEWRESKPKHSWPVLANEDDRWQVRAAIDAVVAQAYGLSREQYVHVLSTFSHKSYPKAPELCLKKFDELTVMGRKTFTRKYDPYWDVPLVETLPKPAIELPSLPSGETHKIREERAVYGGKDLFGNNVPANLSGEVVMRKRKGRRKEG